MQVRDLMTLEVKTCHAQTPLNEVARLMWENDCGAVPVLDEDRRPLAVITDRDICMISYFRDRPLSTLSARDVVRDANNVISCKPTDRLSVAERLMQDHQIRRLVVVNDEGRLAGILSINDIATHTQLKGRAAENSITPTELATTMAAICAHRQSVAAARSMAH